MIPRAVADALLFLFSVRKFFGDDEEDRVSAYQEIR